MAIQFSKDVESYTTTQKATRAKHFLEFASKKQLETANVLGEQELEFAKSIKGTFSFSLHVDKRYMAVTLYKANAQERKYQFLIVDLQEKAIAESDSIKNAKADILAQVEEDANTENAMGEIATAQEPEIEEQADEEEDVADLATRALARQMEEMFADEPKSKKAK